MYAHPCGRHWYSGSDRSDASQVSARARPSALSGSPKKSPTHGFSVLSCERTTVHSPEKSVVTPAPPFWARGEPAAQTASAAVRSKTIPRCLLRIGWASARGKASDPDGNVSHHECSVNERDTQESAQVRANFRCFDTFSVHGRHRRTMLCCPVLIRWTTAIGLVLILSSPWLAAQQGPASPPAAGDPHGTVDKYCAGCHNQRLKSGGLALDRMDYSDVAASAGVWEKAI